MEKGTAQLEQAMKDHDWYFDYTDDGAVWRRGKKAHEAIVEALKKLPLAEAKALWAKHAPKNFPFPL